MTSTSLWYKQIRRSIHGAKDLVGGQVIDLPVDVNTETAPSTGRPTDAFNVHFKGHLIHKSDGSCKKSEEWLRFVVATPLYCTNGIRRLRTIIYPLWRPLPSRQVHSTDDQIHFPFDVNQRLTVLRGSHRCVYRYSQPVSKGRDVLIRLGDMHFGYGAIVAV